MANILVVDDDPDLRRLLKKILVERGHKVTEAANGMSGMGSALLQKPDLIILDLHLPQMDGFEVCRRLKTDQATSKIPIIMITAAFPELEDAEKGFEAGADEYVIKPFAKDILLHNIERLLGNAV